MNKKIISFLTALLLSAAALTACAPSDRELADGGISVVTTIFPQYDFARQIGGDRIRLKMLTTPGGESHSYEPTPQDIKVVSECDIFICAGGESDIWYNSVLKTVDTSDMTVISLMDCVETVEEEAVEGMSEKLSVFGGEAEEKEYDEHVWTSLKNAQLISKRIGEAMAAADSANADFYASSTDEYIKRLSELDLKYAQAVESAENKTLVFGDRFPFRYLFDDYGLKYYAAFPGCSTDSDVSAKTMLFLINRVKEEKLPAVYYIEFGAKKIADAVAEETGAEPLLFHSCHTVSKEEFNSGATYLSLMEQNLENLKRGLNIESDRM
ncbi:MAG: metal ABC transporter substrate-binding protein [Bacteroides sp.]|nr:metal ABC transporter substrate-binding protein [Bacteroides sp.]